MKNQRTNGNVCLIGIDLGTTNSSLAWMDLTEETPQIRDLPVPQLKQPGEWMESELLPSFLYTPPAGSIPAGSLNLPWSHGEETFAVGTAARDANMPNRIVASAKSWLCHTGVNRRARILPWTEDATATDRPYAKSPVDATRLYLEHLKHAWEQKFPERPVERQILTITIPASFDETARELTLEAAEAAGLRNVTLLEEPLAAFYCWMNKIRNQWDKRLNPGDTVLVVDIGGGTSDFSLIEVGQDRTIRRISTGDHLLLGGDNMDLAAARMLEQEKGLHLPHESLLNLTALIRKQKELLLKEDAPDSAEITLFSKGASLIGGSKRFTLRRDALRELLETGFFPEIAGDDHAEKRGTLLKRMGLPYEPDPAITRHLLGFLRYSAGILPETASAKGNSEIFKPDHILFNGGVLIPEQFRRRIRRIIAAWFGQTPETLPELESPELNLAVSRGAVQAAAARYGHGLQVRCGCARTYCLQVGSDVPENTGFLCILPRGTDEGTVLSIDRKFLLQPNQKVSFPLWNANSRPSDQAGDLLHNPEGLKKLHHLVSILQSPKSDPVHAKINAELTETGILQIRLRSENGKQEWPLHYDIRVESEETPPSGAVHAETVLEQSRIDLALEMLDGVFQKQEIAPLLRLNKSLEEYLGLPRREIPLDAMRQLADRLLNMDWETMSGETRRRWLNLTGFLMRPGFGDLRDRERVAGIWKLRTKSASEMKELVRTPEWWIFWRRIAPGLSAGQQRSLFTDLWNEVNPKLKPKLNEQVRQEMWRCLASLEQAEPGRKVAAGNALLTDLPQKDVFRYWALARLGSRRLFHAGPDKLIPVSALERWLKQLLAIKKTSEELRFALRRLASLCGERSVDIHPALRDEVRAVLKREGVPEKELDRMKSDASENEQETAAVLGDSIPLGLRLVEGSGGNP